MTTTIIRVASDLAARGERFAIATVVRVEGSSSAKPGSKAIIDSFGTIVAGWVGGGCAESAVRHQALKCLANRAPQMITLDMTDELLGVGMPCGGVMDVYIEPVLPKPELLIVGHGRIAEALASLGSMVGFSILVDDPAADARAFPQADRLIVDDVDLSVPRITPDTYVVIATQHKNDHVSLQRALDAGARYVALIASRHRADLVLDYLRDLGTPPENLRRVHAPAGIEIGASTPEEIALSIMGEIVAERRGSRSEKTEQAVIRECDFELPAHG